MNFKDYILEEWDKTYDVVYEDNSLRVLLLHLVHETGLKESGRKNLIAVGRDEQVLWAAEPPKMGRNLGSFHSISVVDEKIVGWYGGSMQVELDLNTGRIIKEQFHR